MNTQMMISQVRAIFKREISGYFGSSVAYVFIAIFLLLLGFFTFYVSQFYEAGQADLRAFFEWHPWIYMFLIPAVAMRLWAEERRMGTLELILTFPITVGEAIIGKFLAAWAFIGISLLLTFPMVLTVMYLGNPDPGAIFCGYIGSFLMAGAFLSVGSMTSSLTRSQVISFILAVVICLFFILAGYPPVTGVLSGWAPRWLIDIVSNLSFLSHYMSMQRGVIDLRDVIYYVSVISFMLFANAIIIQNRKG
ncbi:ABC transporter permease [Desulfonema ishimotonii]|uniref:ABC transporter permease n=1 Tax=Desulfonema ishimotonii TaxID=45657 RepID=A0A401G240_9BACT|nr:ABC transporter permease subunit [Desulfonema ishimotonii]GBC63287.1 ABC transporter permease [Desulfonema ishimotonii]